MTRLTLVSVVFDAEVPLLELQARSVRLYVDAEAIERIFILDNCVFGLGNRRRNRLLKEYGAYASRVTFVRTKELFDPNAATGWRSQQAAKLLIAERVTTEDYVTLDAKNHFTRPIGQSAFVSEDGRARGMPHPYADHPLRASLVHTLRYLQASDAQIDAAIASFPPTATPFVLRSTVVRELISDIETSSGVSFAREFEDHRLLEFFLYSGWAGTRGPGLNALRDGSPLSSPTVWPKAADLSGVEETISEAMRTDAFVFAVHRQALAHADRAARDRVADHWTEIGLFPNRSTARAFIRRFKRSYLPSLILTRSVERIHRWSEKQRPSRSSPIAR